MDKVIEWEAEFCNDLICDFYYIMKSLGKIEYMKYQRNLLRTDKTVAFPILYRKLCRIFKKQIREMKGLSRVDKRLVEENAANFIRLFRINDSFTDMAFYEETEEITFLFETGRIKYY